MGRWAEGRVREAGHGTYRAYLRAAHRTARHSTVTGKFLQSVQSVLDVHISEEASSQKSGRLAHAYQVRVVGMLCNHANNLQRQRPRRCATYGTWAARHGNRLALGLYLTGIGLEYQLEPDPHAVPNSTEELRREDDGLGYQLAPDPYEAPNSTEEPGRKYDGPYARIKRDDHGREDGLPDAFWKVELREGAPATLSSVLVRSHAEVAYGHIHDGHDVVEDTVRRRQ